ncbi:hypothetical protein Cni_G05750 [Canna indica]|uniref:Uncharacterized protein n=1 Tax=Canna indica TaxID=4628 RepID=A0AAQ3Q5P3_9LILI|nr:hypothetical protein Cni_G05750 [Canna indica]
MAIRCLNKQLKVPWFLRDLVIDIQALAEGIKCNRWFHIKRNLNSRAHFLAKNGIPNSTIGDDVHIQNDKACNSMDPVKGIIYCPVHVLQDSSCMINNGARHS